MHLYSIIEKQESFPKRLHSSAKKWLFDNDEESRALPVTLLLSLRKCRLTVGDNALDILNRSN